MSSGMGAGMRAGRIALLVFRYLLAVFFLSAAINKWQQNYLFFGQAVTHIYRAAGRNRP